VRLQDIPDALINEVEDHDSLSETDSHQTKLPPEYRTLCQGNAHEHNTRTWRRWDGGGAGGEEGQIGGEEKAGGSRGRVEGGVLCAARGVLGRRRLPLATLGNASAK